MEAGGTLERGFRGVVGELPDAAGRGSADRRDGAGGPAVRLASGARHDAVGSAREARSAGASRETSGAGARGVAKQIAAPGGLAVWGAGPRRQGVGCAGA